MSSLIGSKPFQVPTNSDLGRLAYLEVLGWEDTGSSIPTIAAATSIAPTVKITMISGTSTISTITAPIDLVNGGQLVLIPLGAFNLDTTGNIALPVVAEISKPITLSYESTTNKWYPHYSTTFNKLTVTAPATNATLTIAESKSLNVSNTVTFTGDDTLTLTTVSITSTTGQFLCGVSNNTLVVGKQIKISGVFGGTGSIVGYTNPTVYYIIVTNGTTTFQLSASLGGSAITTTAGTPTGLTFTCSPVVVVGKGGTIVYNDQTSKVNVLAPSSSADLAGVITDETGYTAGAKLLFSISPTITTSLTTDSTSFDLINTTATTANIAGAATALSIGNTATTAQTVNMFTASTGASTYNFATGATLTTLTKAINIGTGGTTGSTTTISIGSTIGSTTTINGTVNLLNVGTSGFVKLGASGALSADTTSYQIAFTSQSANIVYAGPTTGSAIPTFRSLVSADIPTLNQDTTGTATKATNLAGGLASQIPYQTGAGATAFIANGTTGQILTSNGTSAPAWQANAAVAVGRAVALAMVMGF